MGSDRIVLLSPQFYQHLSFFQGIKALTIQKLIPYFAYEGFNVTILLESSKFDEKRLNLQPGQPTAYSLDSKAEVFRWHL
jgi:hypothetical protein